MRKEERQELLEELLEAKNQIEEALQIAKQAAELLNPDGYEGIRRGWVANIEMALSHDHYWVGGKYDTTMQDTIDELGDTSAEESGVYVFGLDNGEGDFEEITELYANDPSLATNQFCEASGLYRTKIEAGEWTVKMLEFIPNNE